MNKLNKDQIRNLLPHREPMLLVDELYDISPLLLEQKKFLPSTSQKKTGRLWTGNMWRPEHLLVIYKHFEDRIVDFCIENSISSNIKESELIYFPSGKHNE